MAREIKPITKENKNEWIEWIQDQLNTAKNAKYHSDSKNRIFLTQEDDIDICKYILEVMLKTAQSV